MMRKKIQTEKKPRTLKQMKTTFFFFLLFCSVQLQAQKKANRAAGFYGGINLTTLVQTQFTTEPEGWVFNYGGGLFYEQQLNKIFSLRTELGMERKGSKSPNVIFTDNNGNILGTGRVRTISDYLVVPVLGRVTLGSQPSFFVHTGPYLGYLLHSGRKAGVNNASPLEQTNNDTKKIDFGLTTGVGVQYLGNEKLGISFELRNSAGLANTNALGRNYKWVRNQSYAAFLGIVCIL
jgi:hypothetical protein